MTLVDANILIRHLTGEPPDLAARATRFLSETDDAVLLDVVFAEGVYVLESVYNLSRQAVAEVGRSILAFAPIRTVDPGRLLRALDLYQSAGVDFADAYLAAHAESFGVTVTSFDRDFDRLPVDRVEP